MQKHNNDIDKLRLLAAHEKKDLALNKVRKALEQVNKEIANLQTQRNSLKRDFNELLDLNIYQLDMFEGTSDEILERIEASIEANRKNRSS